MSYVLPQKYLCYNLSVFYCQIVTGNDKNSSLLSTPLSHIRKYAPTQLARKKGEDWRLGWELISEIEIEPTPSIIP